MRQAAESWMATFPGDLSVNLYLAKAILFEGNSSEAIKILEKLIDLDPEFLEAQETLSIVYNDGISEKYINTLASVHGLGGSISPNISLPRWSELLLEIFKCINDNELDRANTLLHQVMGLNTGIRLVDVAHLKLAYASQETNNIMQLANLYHLRHPECLLFKLCLADSRLKIGDETGAVDLLHQCVTMDASGQVANRLWGDHHRYSDLWLDKLEKSLDLVIPASIAVSLGWNQLSAGGNIEGEKTSCLPSHDDLNQLLPPIEDAVLNKNLMDDSNCRVEFETEKSTLPDREGKGKIKEEFELSQRTVEKSDKNKDDQKVSDAMQSSSQSTSGIKDACVRSVEQVFERLSKHLKQPGIRKTDNRFPMYVIFSTRSGIEKKFGPQTYEILNNEMKQLAGEIRKRKDWGAIVYYPDDAECTVKYGLQPINIIDPWKLKLSLVDLDQSMAKKGEMIGAILIVGGPDVIPFHSLPNPTDDSDKEVYSDNPYATRDSNYFIPEWIIGRLPGEAGSDAGLLLEQLRQSIRYHNNITKKQPWWTRLLFPFDVLISGLATNFDTTKKKTKKNNFGYTAAIWRRSSIAVYRSLGDASSIIVSPPTEAVKLNKEKIVNASFGYYNLHGVENGANWYGQRDVFDVSNNVDYPVALRPEDIKKNSHSPKAIFTEACYGSNIIEKSVNNAISLKFISIGTNIFIGSTCIAYGSITTPLIGADLLGYLFWKYLGDGYNAGEAFMRSKIELTREMTRRQGYLDGEDQKTLISFVLYGDPLLCYEEAQINTKGFVRSRVQPQLKTITDHESDTVISRRVSRQVLCEVKKALEPYLPGLDDADVLIKQQFTSDCIEMKNSSNEKKENNRTAQDTGNLVVTVSKHIQLAQQLHHHYARVTLNAEGKLVKLSISR